LTAHRAATPGPLSSPRRQVVEPEHYGPSQRATVGPLNLRGSFAGNEAHRPGAGDAQQAKNRAGYA